MSHKSHIIKDYGVNVFNDILVKTDDKSIKILSKPLLSTGRYDVYILENLLQAIEEVLGKDELIKIIDYSVEQQVSGFFGFIVKYISP